MPKAGLASRSQLRVSTRMARRLPALAEKLGSDGAALCRRHRIDAGVLDDRSARVPLEHLVAGFEELLETSGHPSLGLELSQNAEPGAYHTPALVLLASNTLREGSRERSSFSACGATASASPSPSPPRSDTRDPGSASPFASPPRDALGTASSRSAPSPRP